MQLRRLFAAVHATVAVLVVVLMTQIAYIECQGLSQADDALAAVNQLRRVLVAAEMASRERGPANGVLGDATPPDPAKQERLHQARLRTDEALARLLSVLPATGPLSDLLKSVPPLLAEGRQAVDRVAALPPDARLSADLADAVQRMFAVVDALEPLGYRLVETGQQAHAGLADTLISARLAADLREQAGRLGSLFTAPLTRQRPLRSDERLGIERQRGRLDELGRHIAMRILHLEQNAVGQQAARQMQQDYFGTANAYIDEVLARGGASGHYEVDTAQFAARYVPLMEPIVELRDQLLEATLQVALQQRAEARRRLVGLTLGGGLVLVLVGLSFWAVSRRALHAMTRAAHLVSALARGQLHAPAQPSSHFQEVRELQQATEVLRRASIAHQTLADERQRLIEELRDQSNTDYLTGLPNRRGFVTLAEAHLQAWRRQPVPLALAVFDLDHFKRINDTHGHEVGDLVLQAVAGICQRLCRRGDVVARHGGEEFVVLMLHCQLAGATEQAQRLRRGIGQAPLQLPGGQSVSLTASFGVTTLAHADEPLAQALARADSALYEAKHKGRDQVVQAPAPVSPPLQFAELKTPGVNEAAEAVAAETVRPPPPPT